MLLLIPILLDGVTHIVSDLTGITQGFRDTNAWLAAITSDCFPASFYSGEIPGSFNPTMRFVTGALAGSGIIWLVFPYIFRKP